MNLQPEQALERRAHGRGDAAQRLQLALAAANLGDWSWDAASDLFTLGRRTSAILGLPPGQTITRRELRALLHPDDRERARVEIDLALASYRDYRIEYRINPGPRRHRLGGHHGSRVVRRARCRGRDDRRRQDVTEQLRQEEVLRDETRILELLNETGARLASELDLQALLRAITDAATRISGAMFGAFFYNSTDERGKGFVLSTLSGASRAGEAGARARGRCRGRTRKRAERRIPGHRRA